MMNKLVLLTQLLNSMQEKDETKTGKTYTVLVLDKNSVQISDLSPSTVYLFQVQALGNGNVGSNSVEEEFSTLPEGKCRTDLKPVKILWYIKPYHDLFEVFFLNISDIFDGSDGYIGAMFYSDPALIFLFCLYFLFLFQ